MEIEQTNQPSELIPEADKSWLKLAADAFERSTSYFDNNYRKQWEDGLRMFQGRHPRDSKYNSEAFRYRSKIFRPKSRSIVRKMEATANVAFFSSPDVVVVEPLQPNDPVQVASSQIMKELLSYRLDKTIPWYLTVLGGVQDAANVGLVASFQYWKYRTRTEQQPAQGMHPTMGPVQFMREVQVPVEDEPCVELIPIENIRFDPAAQWHNVVKTSPYLIIQFPMFLRDVLDHMDTADRAGRKWRSYGKEVILEARVDSADPLRSARNEMREDELQQTSEVNEFDVVMVHLNFVKVGGEDYTFYTLKDKYILTDPLPIKQVFLHGLRPVVIGYMVIETHKAVPMSPVLLGKDLQMEANEIANQRLDNVKFVLNKRWMVRRGANIDTDSIVKNVPGGVTMVNDVEKDVREITWNDVTSSAFQEQDRVNVDYDELLGNFAQSSVMTSRKLNETVGGMKIMAQGANVVTEYSLRVIAETWIEPVLRQLMQLEQYYETDLTVLSLAAGKAQLWQKYGINPVWDQLLNQELTLSVNVGMGATDPETRFMRFVQAFNVYTQLATAGTLDMQLPEIRTELFGLAGFKDAARFFGPIDPRLLQAQQMLQQAQAQMAGDKQKQDQEHQARSQDLDKREMMVGNQANELKRMDEHASNILKLKAQQGKAQGGNARR